MGVPGFYSWLVRRYPLIKHLIGKKQIPGIDYLYLDMNGIIYKCVKDDSIIFKSQVLPRELQQIWVQVFNYISMIVNLLRPSQMLVIALDGVAPRCKMNNQRKRRFQSAQQYQEHMESYYGYNESVDSQENFKNNSISPGTSFMEQLNEMLRFFIKKKVDEDSEWRKLAIVFTGSDVPGEGEHKIMEFIRANAHNFHPHHNHCFYGADADLIMLALTLPLTNVCIIRQEFIPASDQISILATRKQKHVTFEIIFITILRQYFLLEYKHLQPLMHMPFDLNRLINDFVFLFFFMGNDFLPRCYTYNIRKASMEKLIQAFKNYLTEANDYIVGTHSLNLLELGRLTLQLSKFEAQFLDERASQSSSFEREHEKKLQDQFTEELKVKVHKQVEFLLQMKQIYANRDGSVQKLFYNQKFKIEPSVDPQKFHTLLASYTYGLQFLFRYYFVNLPSWSWYYPYYYAPLLSDLSYYIHYLANTQTNLGTFELGKPFEPFKQLLCILPKQSAELLPKAFQRYLLSSQSPLRHPLDYYPDKFQTDLYGSIQQHESICIIPFLDHQMVNRIYNQGISLVQPIQMQRNVLRNSQLYEYNDAYGEILVQSPFPHIADFRCPLKISYVNLLQSLHWKKQSLKIPPIDLIRMPTLQMRKHIAVCCENKYKKKNFRVHLVKQNETLPLKMGEIVFYGYPLQHSGRVQAILTANTLKKVGPEFDIFNYLPGDSKKNPIFQYAEKSPAKVMNELINLMNTNYQQFIIDKTQTLVFLTKCISFIRTFSGVFKPNFGINYKDYEIVPQQIISKSRLYETTKSQVSFKTIQDEFILNEEVLILNYQKKKYIGAMGRVTGHNITQNLVQLTIYQQSKLSQEKQILEIANTDEVFFTVKFVSVIVGVPFTTLLTIMESVNVSEIPKNKGIPQSIDIGLNLISRRESKLVPNLVRINYAGKEDLSLSDRIKKVQISLKALKLIIEYKQTFPQFFTFMQQRQRALIQQAKSSQKNINWRKVIGVTELFKQDSAINTLMKVYIWLLKKQQTHMPLSSIYSKQISLKKIKKLEQFFKQKATKKTSKFKEQKIIQVNPNFLFSYRLARIGYVYLSGQPITHAIGDQVICLKPKFFGHHGVIIGIDDDKFEVLFQKPSFGKTNLGGLCQNLRGSKFQFRQLFNYEKWPKFIQERNQQNKKKQIGWIKFHDYFLPKFKSKPLANFEDVHAVQNVIPPQLYDYICQAQKNLKQIELEQGYRVVDNKKKQYAFKYNTHQTSIPEQQIINLNKQVKYVEKNNTQQVQTQSKQQEKQTSEKIKTQNKQLKTQKLKYVEKSNIQQIVKDKYQKKEQKLQQIQRKEANIGKQVQSQLKQNADNNQKQSVEGEYAQEQVNVVQVIAEQEDGSDLFG